MGRSAVEGLGRIFAELSSHAGKVAIATDNDAARDRLADRVEALARRPGVRVEEVRPPKAFNDWNDDLRAASRQARVT